MLERDEHGHVRTSSPTEQWEPAWGEITAREARIYINAELRFTWTEKGRRSWWGTQLPRLDGRTPEEVFAAGEYRRVWLVAAGGRMMEAS